jgi:hypothetical protein
LGAPTRPRDTFSGSALFVVGLTSTSDLAFSGLLNRGTTVRTRARVQTGFAS